MKRKIIAVLMVVSFLVLCGFSACETRIDYEVTKINPTTGEKTSTKATYAKPKGGEERLDFLKITTDSKGALTVTIKGKKSTSESVGDVIGNLDGLLKTAAQVGAKTVLVP